MPETKVTSCPAARAGDTEPALAVQRLDIKLERDIFLRSLIRELAGTLEDIVGYDEAAGYISLVGQNIGEWINALYKEALGVTSLSRQQVARCSST